MEIRPILTQIEIFPIKSLDGMRLERAQISAGGALAFDRRWAIVDGAGRVVNGKRTAKVHQLRARFEGGVDALFEGDVDALSVSLQAAPDGASETFNIATELPALARWLGEFFDFPVSIIEDATTGFPDDPDAYGPTIVSTATLEAIASWFPELDATQLRRRFRTNLELADIPAFGEDRLFGAPGEVVNFHLGDVQFRGINPCQRCVVPTRDPDTGAALPKFQQIFTQHRQQTLPAAVNPARFNHFYRLAVNTQIPRTEASKWLQIGDILNANIDR